MAADEARLPDQVARAQGSRAEAQVRDGHRAGLLRIVDEVSLRVVAGPLADDLDRVLVGSDGAVGAKAEEDRPHHVAGLDVELAVVVEGKMGHVVDDAHGEVAPGLRPRQLVEDACGHGRRVFLGRQAVASADYDRIERGQAVLAGLAQGGDDVQVERLSHRPRFLGPVEDGDPARRRRQRPHEVLHREWPVEADLEEADLVAARVQPVDGVVRHPAPDPIITSTRSASGCPT